MQSRLRELRRPVEQVTRTAEQVEAATEVSKSGPQEVVVRGPRLSERLFGTTQSLLTGALETSSCSTSCSPPATSSCRS